MGGGAAAARVGCWARSSAAFTLIPSRSPSAADIRRRQGVLCWQAGQLGAALVWLAAAGDLHRADLALRPLADAVSAGKASLDQAAALDVLQPTMDALPPGSAAAALLSVHRLLKSRGGAADGGLHAAVAALAQLPELQRDSCLRLVCSAVPTLAPGELSEQDAHYLLRWLLVSGCWGVATVHLHCVGALPRDSQLCSPPHAPTECGRQAAARSRWNRASQHGADRAACARPMPCCEPHASSSNADRNLIAKVVCGTFTCSAQMCDMRAQQQSTLQARSCLLLATCHW